MDMAWQLVRLRSVAIHWSGLAWPELVWSTGIHWYRIVSYPLVWYADMARLGMRLDLWPVISFRRAANKNEHGQPRNTTQPQRTWPKGACDKNK